MRGDLIVKNIGKCIVRFRRRMSERNFIESFLTILLVIGSIFGTISSAEASVQATYNQGTLSVALPGAIKSGAWISINTPSAPLTAYNQFFWQYVSSSSLSIPISSQIPPGTYQLRYFVDGGYNLLASAEFVVAQTNLSVTASASNGTISVSFSAPAPNGSDWIAVSIPGSPSTSYAAWAYASAGSRSASLQFSTPGSYEVRYLRNDGYEIAARTSVHISNTSSTGSNNNGNGQVTASVTATLKGTDSIVATYSKSVSTQYDWIAVAAAGAPLSSYLNWKYVTDASGSVTFAGLSAGQKYEIRLFKNNGYALLSSATVDVQQQTSSWDCTVRNEGGRLWMRSYHNQIEEFAWNIGAGGSMAALIDRRLGDATLLAPSFKGEKTDRVAQWTLWDAGNLKVPSTPAHLGVLNTTQAGTGEGIFTPSLRASFSKQGQTCTATVLSHVIDQYTPLRAQNFVSKIPTLTTYEFSGGILTITRELQIREVFMQGVPVAKSDFYLEAWNPFAKLFDNVALSLNESGQPTSYYRANYNVPMYPSIEFANTRGWVVLSSNNNPSAYPAIAIVFGNKPSDAHDRKLNFMDFDHGNVAVLPSVKRRDVPVGSFVFQQQKMYLTRGLAPALGASLDELAASVEPASFHLPSMADTARIKELRALFDLVSTVQGQRTEYIGNLAN